MTDHPEDRPSDATWSDPSSVPPQPPDHGQWPTQAPGSIGPDQRNWAVGAHIGALAASLVTGLAVLGPLLVYLVKKDDHPFVREHARESLNFQLTWMIGGFVAVVIGFVVAVVTVGIGLIVLVPAAIGFAVAWVVFMVRGAMAASRGEYYRYPLTIRMVT